MDIRKLSIVLGSLIAAASTSFGVVVLHDDFNGGGPATVDAGSTNLVGAWTGDFSSKLYTESGGILTASTASNSGANTSQWSETRLGTAVSSNLNIFTTTVKIEVRGFAQSGTGDYADYENFRLGLVARTTTSGALTFHGSDDALALRISSDGRTYSMGYKNNTLSNDPTNVSTMTASPGSSLPTGTLAAGNAIKDFDLTVSSTTWSLTLYTTASTTITHTGTWNLGTGADWGNGTEGLGNSALLMYAQNGRGNVAGQADFLGTSQFSLDSITVSVIPEPGRVALLFGAAAFVLFRRRR